MLQVVACGDPQPLHRVFDAVESQLQPLEDALEGVKLDLEQQLFLGRDVVVESSQADPGLGGDLANGGLAVPLAGNHPGTRGQDEFQLLVIKP